MRGGLDFKLPNREHTGYVTNIQFHDVNVLVKGGNPLSVCNQNPPELGVGQYNVSNLKVQPSYGLWVRHAKELTVYDCSFNCETRDSRYAIMLDDVRRVNLSAIKMVLAGDNQYVLRLQHSSDVIIKNVVYYNQKWDSQPIELVPGNYQEGTDSMCLPQ